jgi:hypothetical protein
MNNSTRINVKKNKTNLNKSKKTIIIYNPYEKYKNTKLIPKTSIITYMFSGYKEYLTYKEKCDKEKRNTLNLDDCFIINKDAMPVGLRKNEINLSLKMNPKLPLYKFLTYCFYSTQSSIFNSDINNAISTIKFQVGKDIKRSDRTINGKSYPGSFYNEDNYYSDTDLFYQNIIDYMKLYHNKINLNIVNKIALLSCQNMFNFMSNLISLKLLEILKPEINAIFRPNKQVNITITKNEISMELYLKCQLIMSRDQEPIDPEYPCGNLEFNLYFDLLKNRYELKNFILDYDIDKCGPEIQKEPIAENVENGELNNQQKSKMKKYILPVGLATAGIIAMPFLLPLLGGKTKKNKTKKNKTRKIKRKL